MELLLLLVVGGFVLFGLFGLLGLAGLGFMAKGSRKIRERAIEDKGEVLDALFDGRDVVTYRVNLETIPADMLIEDAAARGYDMTSRTNVVPSGEAADLVFTKRSAVTRPSSETNGHAL